MTPTTSTLAEPVRESPAHPAPQVRAAGSAAGSAASPNHGRPARAVRAALLLLAAVFFSLHFIHLKADFPNHSPWMDWAKYTDEGWYGDAAIRHYNLGHWNVPGDFNPAAALPVWPTLEIGVFRLTGVSLVAGRALTVTVFGLILLCSYLLIRRWTVASNKAATGESETMVETMEQGRSSLAPAIAVLLLAVNPFCFVFSRLAILEPLLILLTLVALLTASSCGAAAAETWTVQHASDPLRRSLLRRLPLRRLPLRRLTQRRFVTLSVALGLLLPLLALTKTTSIFLFPAVFWLLFASAGYAFKPFLRAAGVACGVAVAAWGLYFLAFVRPHYLIDYRYLFSANAYTGITLETFWTVLHDAVHDISWIGETLFGLAMVAVAGSLVILSFPQLRRRLRSHALMEALLLWIFGYGAFLAYHANLQPRYYLVIAIPLTMLTAVAFDHVLAAALGVGFGFGFGFRFGFGSVHRMLQATAAVTGAAVAFAAFHGALQTLSYVRHPEYGWWSAAQQIRNAIDREAALPHPKGVPAHSRLLLSISGSELSLMTGLPSICDDFGTMSLPDRVAAYKPGWFASWNYVEDDKMEALAPLFRLERVATIPVFDDSERNLLILYRLDPLSSPGARGHAGRRRYLSLPHRLRTKVGEQPSPVQLRH